MSKAHVLLRSGVAGAVCALLCASSVASAQETTETPVASKAASDEASDSRHGFGIEFGALAVARSMTLDVDANRIEHKPQPYAGTYVRTRIQLARFQSLDAALRLDGEFGYGVARNAEVSSNLGREAITQMSAGGARLGIARQLSAAFELFVGVGGHVTSFVIEANPDYTGHRYVAGEATVAVEWLAESAPLTADFELAALPVLSMNQSSGGYGDGRGFGGRAQAGIGWNFLEREVDSGYSGARLSLRYRYQRFRALFPQRRVSLDGGVSVDQQHGAFLTFGYFL